MIEQQGRIVQLENANAVVRIGPTSGCSACDEGRGCGAGIFGRLLRRKATSVAVPNEIQALEGQAVTLGISESVFLRLLLRFYLFPLLAGLVGAAFGYYLASRYSAGPGLADSISVLGALVSAATVLWFGRNTDPHLSGQSSMRLLRKVGEAPNERNCPSVSA